MGRTLKRVPMDFNWPMNKVWDGYGNPHYKECPKCKAGYSVAYKLLEKHINSMLWDTNALKEESYAKITGFLAGRMAGGIFGHDCSDTYTAICKLGELAGLPDSWATCAYCGGSGVDPEVLDAYEAWKPYEPPTGEGYQLWETTSEGSPTSPVFSSLEELCEWCADNATTFAHYKTTKEEWMQMLNDDFVVHRQGNAIFM